MKLMLKRHSYSFIFLVFLMSLSGCATSSLQRESSSIDDGFILSTQKVRKNMGDFAYIIAVNEISLREIQLYWSSSFDTMPKRVKVNGETVFFNRVKAPVGRYRITEVIYPGLLLPVFVGSGNLIMVPTDSDRVQFNEPLVEFTVLPNSITYIGRFNVDDDQVKVVDEFSNDLTAAKSKYSFKEEVNEVNGLKDPAPSYKESEIISRLLNLPVSKGEILATFMSSIKSPYQLTRNYDASKGARLEVSVDGIDFLLAANDTGTDLLLMHANPGPLRTVSDEYVIDAETMEIYVTVVAFLEKCGVDLLEAYSLNQFPSNIGYFLRFDGDAYTCLTQTFNK